MYFLPFLDACPNPNEVYDHCIAPCPPRRCDVDDRMIRCAAPPKLGDESCRAGCRCADGYYRNSLGVCVTRDKCRQYKTLELVLLINFIRISYLDTETVKRIKCIVYDSIHHLCREYCTSQQLLAFLILTENYSTRCSFHFQNQNARENTKCTTIASKEIVSPKIARIWDSPWLAQEQTQSSAKKDVFVKKVT